MPETQTVIYTTMDKPTFLVQENIVDFFYNNLDKFGDPRDYIKRALDYALSSYPSEGGSLIIEYEGDRIVGGVIMNKTGMSGYIPENVLVYIAVHSDMRGQGLGHKLMSKAKEVSTGDIALHVEEENPAVQLYEKEGFKKKYIEMRWEESGDE